MFGGQSSTPFGTSTGGFGQSNTAPAFGSPNPAPFGSSTPSAFGGFGAPAPAPSAFGGFGAPAPAPTGGFGGFGAPAPAPSAFGSSAFGAAPTSSPFGAPAPTGGGLFGSAPAPATGGLFGSSPAPALGGFGSSTSTFGGFGSTSTTPAFGSGSTFGAPAPAPTGLFGSSTAPATSGFGGFGTSTSVFGSAAPAPSTGLFGAPAPAPSTGLFGAPAAPTLGGVGGGTKIQPYQVTNRQDGTSSINLLAISAMPAYENKSFEELRFEDYSQGNRGVGTGAPSGGFGGFGAPAPAPSGGLFGAPSSTPAFGAPAPATSGFGGFGSPTPAPFGAPAPAPFGAPAPAPFGAPATSAFGAPAPSSGFGTSAFGAKPSGGLFGAPAPSSGGLFGSSPAPASGGLFGSTASSAPGGFGSQAPAPSLFGAPAPAPFGAPAPAPFGAPAPAPFGGFGSPSPAPSGGLFGAPAPSAFGAPAPGTSLFGAPAPAPGSSLFGAPKPAGMSLFGAPAPSAPAPFSFAAPAPAFGAPAPPPYMPMPAAPPVGSVIPPATDEILAAQLASLEKNRKELEKSDNFRRKTLESSSVTGASLSERDSIAALAPIRIPYAAYRASPKSSAKLRPRGFASPEKTPTPALNRLGSGGKPMPAPDTMAASAATRLIVNISKPKLKLSLQADQKKTSPLKLSAENGTTFPQQSYAQTPKPPSPTTPSTPEYLETPNGNNNSGYKYYQEVIGSPEEETNGPRFSTGVNVTPRLTKAGYSCSPPIDFLASLPAEDLAAVPNFSIERPGVGRIEWEGAVDIRGIDLDQVVVIEPKSASVYTKEEEENKKPPIGTKLNRSAIITLEGVYAPEATLESQEKFSKKVERQTKKMGAQLIDYDATSGVWKLKVQHFSRYALDDEDDDSSSEIEAPAETTRVHFESGERDGRSRAMGEGMRMQRQATPYKAPRVLKSAAVVVEEDDMDSGSDMEVTEETKVLLEAEAAFAALESTVTEQRFRPSRKRQEEMTTFLEEQVPEPGSVVISQYIPTMDDIHAALSMGSVCNQISIQVGSEKSSIDYGRRLGRSFRVGWSPDGSFISPNKDGNLVRRRPKFSSSASTGVDCLECHRANAVLVGEKGSCPEFSLPAGDGLANVLGAYSERSNHSTSGPRSMANECFALLTYLGKSGSSAPIHMSFQGSPNDNTSETRRLFGIQAWLKDSCINEVDLEIKQSLSDSDRCAALLAAISGGDTQKACTVADDLGFHHLATMLAAGPEAKSDILSEVMAWTDSGATSKMPPDLIRSYFILGGDLTMEEDIFKRGHSPFDWRRRLAMDLTYCPATMKQGVSSLVNSYDMKVSKGLTPFPAPRYTPRESRKSIECVTYRLLRLGGQGAATPLSAVVDPRGHTTSMHDFSLAFHLAAAISAIGCSMPLSEVEEQILIDGYAAQLAAAGQWEWAVYTLMCRFGQTSDVVTRWKRNRAKTMVLQNYRRNSNAQRGFLESFGVPCVWFDEALALQCATNGDVFGYLSHLVKVNADDACASLETTLIPNIFFMNQSDLTKARMVLDAFSVDSESLAGAVLDFFQIYEAIALLGKATQEEVDTAVPLLLERCDQVEQVFASYRFGEAKLQGPALRIIPEAKIVPMACFLAEVLSQLSLFKFQLRALQSRLGLSSTATQILNLAQAGDVMDLGMSARDNVLRWLL